MNNMALILIWIDLNKVANWRRERFDWSESSICCRFVFEFRIFRKMMIIDDQDILWHTFWPRLVHRLPFDSTPRLINQEVMRWLTSDKARIFQEYFSTSINIVVFTNNVAFPSSIFRLSCLSGGPMVWNVQGGSIIISSKDGSHTWIASQNWSFSIDR